MHRFAIVLLAFILFSGCDGRSDGKTAPSELGLYAPLRGFYAALADLQAGRRREVAVLQIGDSHSANDSFSGEMRAQFQARFGDGGRGLLPPGIPYRYYKPARVTVTMDGWRTVRAASDAGPFGFAAVRQEASGPATMAITADPPDLAQLTIEALGQSGGGSFEITTSDGKRQMVTTASARPALLRIRAPSGPGTAAVQLRALGDGPVDLLAWTAERPGPGVTWSNLGTIGAQASLLPRFDPAVMAEEAKALQPALIVLAFGTNEGFKDDLDLAGYPDVFRAAIAALHRAAPGATIMVVGPPGGVRGNGNGAGTACAGDLGAHWSVPVNLPKVRHIESTAAEAEHLFFWNWAATMGGDCQIVPWAETDPPLAAHDHVHLLKPGYQQTADALFATMMRGYDLYSQSRVARR